MKRLLLAASLLALPPPTLSWPAAAQAPSVMGTWLTASKTAQIRIAPCPDASRGPICGTVVRLQNARGPDGNVVAPEAAVDFRNSDPALRGRKVLGMVLLYDFKAAGPNTYEEGTIYNGENGKTYKANVSLQPDGTLRLRGYVGSPMFGETQIWTRVQ
jgi:uncharacterized protein (DUF2147 family)